MKQLKAPSNHATAVTTQSPRALDAKPRPAQLKGNGPTVPTAPDSNTLAVDKEARDQRLHDLILSACKVTGIRSRELANRMVIQVVEALVQLKSREAEDDLIKAIAAIGEMEPQNLTEAMLATQMIAANDAALMFLSRATIENQHPEAIDTNVLRATRLMRLFREQLEAMQKLKGKSGQQSVRVEHVHVHDGGQAIVGTVTSSGTGRGGWGMMQEITETPHEPRCGRLLNGNPSGDFAKAARCGAKNRRGTPCMCPAMPNGRCRLHGGFSTGPKTPAGIERIRKAVTKHGRYTKNARLERARYQALMRQCRETLKRVEIW